MQPLISLKKVRVHNLKGVDLELVPGQLIVFTGVSGSGKSSLAFDTIYAEGQRRYIESLSHQVRRSLAELPKPEAESISGIAPTIAIEQKLSTRTPRSTVGTLTGIYDFLRVLYARIAIPHCPISGEPLIAQSREAIIAQLQTRPDEAKLIFLAPYARGKKGEFREEFKELLSQGFTRLRVNRSWVDLAEVEELDGKKAHDIDIAVDRIRGSEKSRIAEAVTLALELGKGFFSVWDPEKEEEVLFSQSAFAPKSGLSYGPLEPHDFSFNHPSGMCPTCQGIGKNCPSCRGERIKPYPAAARLSGKRIAEVTALPLAEARVFLATLPLSSLERQIGGELLSEIEGRLRFLIDVGLSYLSLDRSAPTLSGGESQRVRLASQIGAGLVGAIYVLDEPSIGLHPVDNHKLIEALFHLRDQGNTVLVVEHDAEMIFAADTVVDVGPGAGKRGGEILAHGTAAEIAVHPRSITGAYLSGKRAIPIPQKRRVLSRKKITIHRALHNNLKELSVSIPLGGLLCITGVSGSGKSSLISDILYPALANRLYNAKLPIGKCEKIEGLEYLDRAIAVDQSPIGRTPRSNPATYIKLFDEIRELFASLPESQIRGFDAGHFSFNVREGSCSYCRGLGQTRIDMDFMEDVWIDCPQCKGRRFDPDILSIRYKGKSIADLLEIEVAEALTLFEAIPSIRRKLDLLSRVGLDYLALGQPSTTLSGGEAQRIKLSRELSRSQKGHVLYLLDEPTTGLHFSDIERLIAILQELVDKGNTVLVIEHNLDLIRCADWILDLGPGAGPYGGECIGEGTPEEIAQLDTPTGRALKGTFSKTACTPLGEKASGAIRVKGASQHNLKSVSLSLPHGQISVFTGPSGSGKSSLAFDTIYAEGQRRYTETLSPYARSLVKPLSKPKAEKIEGLPPSIALEQKTGGLNPRSTVGTMAEIYDHLRILYAHLGTPFDPETGEEIRHISKETVVSKALSLPEGEKIQILAPLTPLKKESFEEMVERLNRAGFLRLRLNGQFFELDEKIPFAPHKKNELYLVIDRLVVGKKSEKRLYEAVTKAVELSDGIVVLGREESDLYFNLSFAVESTGKSYPPIIPQTFSFNHDAGMCQECQGLGILFGAHLGEKKRFLRYSTVEITERLFKEKGTKKAFTSLAAYFKKCGLDVEEPLKNLSSKELHLLLNGAPEVSFKRGLSLRWIGIHTLFAQLARIGKGRTREALLPSMRADTCPACEGTRLNPLARNVRIKGKSIADICRLPLEEALSFLRTLPLKKAPFLKEVHAQICSALDFLLSIGLGYLFLDRSAPTLSGGELQRIRLARQFGSGLTSCLYVLDEPTIGLHPHNNELLNAALKRLRDLGNTLLLVEHDPMTIHIADLLFDFGPKAGREGGQIIASGTIEEIKNNPNSLTGAYLSSRKTIAIPEKRRPFSPDIQIENASLHNLKHISVSFPRSAITCLTGVSGSGKSTLMRYLLGPAAEQTASAAKKIEPFEFRGARFFGLCEFEKVISIDQTPIGKTARSDVSTYTEIHPLLRAHFAALPLAKAKGLKPGQFSPNHRRGMCRTCWGLGYRSVSLQFLPSVRIRCEACRGYRLNSLALEVQYKGKHLGQVLEMRVEEALSWLAPLPKIAKRLQILQSVGLSYLQLGQELASLSGGEAQRLRLSRELAKRETGKTLYLIDEPTVGLHSEDIAHLLPIFHRLADKKNTVVIIEHNLDVIANADYLIDLGPDAGPNGGSILATGTPEEVAESPISRTAPYLKAHLQRNHSFV